MRAREILVKNHTILVDEEDFAFLSRFKWSVCKDKKTYYAKTNFFLYGKNYGVTMHKLITCMRNTMIDHKNRNGLDNRKENLRFCTARQNSYNRVRTNKLGFRGVYKTKRSPNYSYQIQANGKRYHKHGFKTAEEAAREYDRLNRELHGEFGIRNFKD